MILRAPPTRLTYRRATTALPPSTCNHSLHCGPLTYLSFNEFERISGLDRHNALRELFLIHNRISAIKGVDHLSGLELLELGDNRLRDLDGVGVLRESLTELYVGRNKVERLIGASECSRLRILSAPSNRLTCIDGMSALSQLSELYLSNNGLTSIGGIQTLTKLTVLDVAANQLTRIEAEILLNMPSLTELWMNDNRIADDDAMWSELERLNSLNCLRCVYLIGNGLSYNASYRRRVSSLLPRLTQIDADDV